MPYRLKACATEHILANREQVMPHAFHDPVITRDFHRRSACCAASADARAEHPLYQVALWMFLLFLAGGCATVAPPPAATPVPEAPPKVAEPIVPAPTSKAPEIVSTARSLIGTPYKYGGRSPQTGFDCSGFVGYVYNQFDIELPRSSSEIMSVGSPLQDADLNPGDIVIYNIGRKGRALHVGIATGNGTFVHSPSAHKKVEEVSLSSPYWQKRFICARRIL